MKYIKDRFYNPRKRSPSLGAPVHNLFTREERTAFSCGLWVQRYNKFLKPPNIRRSFFSRASSELETLLRNSEATEGKKPSKLPAVHLSRNRVRHFRLVGSPSSLGNPSLLSCECKGTTTFRIHQIFGEVFFESLARASYTYYIYRNAQALLYPSKLAHHSRLPRHLRRPVLLSCECKGTTTFWNHQIFSKLFSPKATPRKHGIRKQEG